VNTDDLLTRAIADLGARAPHDPDLAGTIRRRSRWRIMVAAAPIAAALAVLAVIVTVIAARGSATDHPATAPSACAPVSTAVLPTWARDGFSDPEPSMPYVTSRSGHLVAIIFGDPLSSPEAPDHGNKILWVSNAAGGSGDLVITGTREGDGETMTTTLPGGPGPSLVDMPGPGCWHLELAWGSIRDSIDLRYVSP